MSGQSLRPSRFQLPNLIAGLVIGGLIVGCVVPLVGGKAGSDAASAPVFAGSDGTAAGIQGGVASPATSGTDGGSTATVTGGGAQATTGASRPASGGTGVAASTGGAASGSLEGPRAARKASDVGITADTIRIGAFVLDCAGCAAVGIQVPSAAAYEAGYRAVVNDLNARGGINGRKVELATARYDPVKDGINGGGTERAACLKLTEQDKVFAVVLGGTLSNSCVFDEHKTPLITMLEPADDPQAFNRSGGRLWAIRASLARTATDVAQKVVSEGIITRSTKWGLLYMTDQYKGNVENIVLPELKRQGVVPAHVSTMPNDESGMTIAAAQEVPRMRAAGVTHVLMMVNYYAGTKFTREAARNNWKPQWVVSEYTAGIDDFAANEWAKGGNFDGAIGIASTNDPTPKELATDPVTGPCLASIHKVPERAKVGPNDQDLWFCTMLRVFQQATTNAGVNPTRGSLVGALARLGEFPMFSLLNRVGSFGGAYRFGPTRWSGARFSQKKVWTTPCPRKTVLNYPSCFMPAGPVKPMAG